MSNSPAAPAPHPAVRTDTLAPWPCRAMLGLLDRDPDALAEGYQLPLGWHWLYFKDAMPASALGPDGHGPRGGFMPKVDLPRRMWAGGTLRALRPVLIGEAAELRSEVRDVKEKMGKSGRLVFVDVARTVLQDGRPCVEEEQVIVYREAERIPSAQTAPPDDTVLRESAAQAGPVAQRAGRTTPGGPPTAAPAWTETLHPTPVTLFQFSALTWNAHRIHYDHPYVTRREGYPGLLVHGPLTALLLLDAATRHAAAPPSSFRYRALAPLYVNEPITLVGRREAPTRGTADAEPHDPATGHPVVEARGPTGTAAMRGRVAW